MWKHAITSVRGSAHHVNGLPCQDASGAVQIGDILVCALSDGAGSAQLSHLGSRIAVRQSLRFFREYFRNVKSPQIIMRDLGAEQGVWLLESIRERIARFAARKGQSDQEFAGTLLVAVLSEGRSIFYQVGDGFWCARKSGVLGAITWPEQGEFVGQTVFVTSSVAFQSIQCVSVEGGLDFAIGMTDGLERLALDLQAQVPHAGFCEPLIASLRQASSVNQYQESLDAFLSSQRVCERTDDDKSLVLIAHEDSL